MSLMLASLVPMLLMLSAPSDTAVADSVGLPDLAGFFGSSDLAALPVARFPCTCTVFLSQ